MNANTYENTMYEEILDDKERHYIMTRVANVLAESTASAIRQALDSDSPDAYEAAIDIEIDNYLAASYLGTKAEYFAALRRRNIDPQAVTREPFRFPAAA